MLENISENKLTSEIVSTMHVLLLEFRNEMPFLSSNNKCLSYLH